MKNKEVDLTKDFNKLVRGCESLLIRQSDIIPIRYLSHKKDIREGVKESKNINKEAISKLVNNGANIYALWVKRAKGRWELKYIGQRKESGIRERLCQHLFSKHKKTGSQLENIIREVGENHKIGVSCIRVVPDAMRSSVEEGLISEHKDSPLWNTHNTMKSRQG